MGLLRRSDASITFSCRRYPAFSVTKTGSFQGFAARSILMWGIPSSKNVSETA